MTPPTPTPAPRHLVDVGRGTHARLLQIATREGLTRGGLPSPSQAIAWALDANDEMVAMLRRCKPYVQRGIADGAEADWDAIDAMIARLDAAPPNTAPADE